MSNSKKKLIKRSLRHNRVRSKISGSEKRPRLSVFRANANIYAQLIDDGKGVTLAAASSKEVTTKGKKSDIAAEVGKLIASRAKEKNITSVVFDRGGFAYHGRVKALAEAARENGLQF